MKSYLLLFVTAVLLFSLLYLSQQKPEVNNDCSLNLISSCLIGLTSQSDFKIKIDVAHPPIKLEEANLVIVSVLNDAMQKIGSSPEIDIQLTHAELIGVNMNMGHIPLPLTKMNAAQYQLHVTPVICALDEMHWRINFSLVLNGKPHAFSVNFFTNQANL